MAARPCPFFLSARTPSLPVSFPSSPTSPRHRPSCFLYRLFLPLNPDHLRDTPHILHCFFFNFHPSYWQYSRLYCCSCWCSYWCCCCCWCCCYWWRLCCYWDLAVGAFNWRAILINIAQLCKKICRKTLFFFFYVPFSGYMFIYLSCLKTSNFFLPTRHKLPGIYPPMTHSCPSYLHYTSSVCPLL